MYTSVIIFCVATILTMIGVLAFVDPELAFRFSNPFQIKEIELTETGVMLEQIGGAVLISIGVLMVIEGLHPALWILFAIAVIAPFRYYYPDVIRM